MYWIRIALEKCPKCDNETMRVLMVIRAEWIGGERLKCTTLDCKQRGVVRVKVKDIKFKYFTRRRRPKRKRIVINR